MIINIEIFIKYPKEILELTTLNFFFQSRKTWTFSWTIV